MYYCKVYNQLSCSDVCMCVGEFKGGGSRLVGKNEWLHPFRSYTTACDVITEEVHSAGRSGEAILSDTMYASQLHAQTRG